MKLINNYGQTVEQYVLDNIGDVTNAQHIAYHLLVLDEKVHLHYLVELSISARYGLLPDYELEDGPLNALLKNDLKGYFAKADHIASTFAKVIIIAHMNFIIDFDKSEIEKPYLDLMNQKK